MKILFILENYYPNVGGVETLFKSLIESLADEGHQIILITNRIYSKLPKKEILKNTIIYRYKFGNRYLFTLLAFFPAIRHARKCDLIHTTSYNAGVPAFIAGFFTRKKVIITFHEVWGELWFQLPFFNSWSLRFHFWFEKILLRFPFHRIIAVSDYTKQKLMENGIPEKKIVRIYNGLKYQKFKKYLKIPKAPPNEKYTFLYFGRLGISKGLDILLKAALELSREDLEFRLQLIIPYTPRSLFKKIIALINEYKLERFIHLNHELNENELFEKVLAADSVVIPSYSEGFGFTALESVILGKPLISSQQGSLKEVVGGRFISFAEQDPKNLAVAMRNAMQNQWDFSKVKEFKLENTISKYLDLYQNILNCN